VELKLLVRESALEICLELEALQGDVVHRGLKDLVPALAFLLRHVHGDVGVAKQVLHAFLALRVRSLGDRDAKARAHEDLFPLDVDRHLESADDAIGHLRGLDAVAAVFEQDRELVPAQPRRGIGRAKTRPESFSDLPKHMVAGGVSQGIIDRLEVVEVHEQDGHGLEVSLLALQRVGDAIAEQRAIGEVRHRVVERLMRELLLECLAFADISRVEHDPLHVRILQKAGPKRLHEDPRSVGAFHPELEQAGVSIPFTRSHEEGKGEGLVLGVDEIGEPRPLQPVGLVAQYSRGRGARVADRRIGVDHGDHVAGVLHERGESRLALLDQQVLGERGALEGEGDLQSEGLDAVRNRSWDPGTGRHDDQPPKDVLHEQWRSLQEFVVRRELELRPERAMGAVQLQRLTVHEPCQFCFGDRRYREGPAEGVFARRRDEREPPRLVGHDADPDLGRGAGERPHRLHCGAVDAVAVRGGDERGARFAKGLLARGGPLLIADHPGHPCDDEKEQGDGRRDHDLELHPVVPGEEAERRGSEDGRGAEHRESGPREPVGSIGGALGERVHGGMERGHPPGDVEGDPPDLEIPAARRVRIRAEEGETVDAVRGGEDEDPHHEECQCRSALLGSDGETDPHRKEQEIHGGVRAGGELREKGAFRVPVGADQEDPGKDAP
jgi:hypothetical protein